MRYSILLAALMIAGCGGGGGSSSGGSSGDDFIDPAILCPILTVLIDGECVSLLDDSDPPPPDNSLVRPQLTAGDPVLMTVTLDWAPPDESWEGLPPPFLAGYVISVSEWQSGLGVFQVIQTIAVDNPGIVTYVLDLPGPGRFGITVGAISTTGSESPNSNIEIVDIPAE